jgi:hypothetical protein
MIYGFLVEDITLNVCREGVLQDKASLALRRNQRRCLLIFEVHEPTVFYPLITLRAIEPKYFGEWLWKVSAHERSLIRSVELNGAEFWNCNHDYHGYNSARNPVVRHNPDWFNMLYMSMVMPLSNLKKLRVQVKFETAWFWGISIPARQQHFVEETNKALDDWTAALKIWNPDVKDVRVESDTLPHALRRLDELKGNLQKAASPKAPPRKTSS